MNRNSSFKIKRVAKLYFDAVAALAGVNGHCKLVEFLLCKIAITIPALLNFIDEIGDHYQGKKVYVFLDNLRLHHIKQVALKCERFNIEIIFNSCYSSEYNSPLGLLLKSIFRKDLLQIPNFKNHELIIRTVASSIERAFFTLMRR